MKKLIKSLGLICVLGLVSCKGGGNIEAVTNAETGVVQIVETVDYYSHQTCEAVDTETFKRICNPLGLKPLASSWTATSNVEGMDGILLENGNLYTTRFATGHKAVHANNSVSDTEFSVNINVDPSEVSELFEWDGTSLDPHSSGNITITMSGTVERESNGSIKFVESSSIVTVTVLDWVTYVQTDTNVELTPKTSLEWTLD